METAEKERWKVMRQRLLAWTVMTNAERELAGEPTTVADWCAKYGVSDRWVTKTRAKDDFKLELNTLQKRRVNETPILPASNPFSPEAAEAEMSNAELFGEVVRTQLQMAARGDKTALDFIKSANVSKPFVDALTAEFQTEFPDETDDELVAMFLDTFEELCVAELEARGWRCERAAS